MSVMAYVGDLFLLTGDISGPQGSWIERKALRGNGPMVSEAYKRKGKERDYNQSNDLLTYDR